MTSVTDLARTIVRAIERSPIDTSTEGAAHRAIAAALQARRLDVATEVRLGPADRIDLMVGAVGIEVKVRGQRRQIFAQLERYATHEEVQALVLATGAPWPSNLAEVGGKPLLTASLSKGWL